MRLNFCSNTPKMIGWKISLNENSFFEKADSPINYKPNLLYWKSYGTDIYDYLKAPMKWKGNEIANATFFLGAATLMYANDGLIMNGVQQNKTASTTEFDKYVEPLGRGYTVLGGMTACYLGGLVFKNEKLQRASLQAIKAGAITSLFTQATKLVTQRARPYQNLGPYYWNSLKSTDYRSFFSGHSSYAFCAATMVALYSKHKWVDIAAYTLASFVAFSRVNDYKHWGSDVFVGAIAGITISNFVFHSSRY